MDIYSLLKKDHVEVNDLLDELIALNDDDDDDYRGVVIEQISKALIPHARAEESVLYNSIRSISSDNSVVMQSYKEHLEAEALLRTLQVKDKLPLNWKSTAIKLKDALEHHISEEEGKVFTEARKLFSQDEAKMMGDAFEKLKAKIAEEGFMKNSFDLVANLMPPRFLEKLKNLKPSANM